MAIDFSLSLYTRIFHLFLLWIINHDHCCCLSGLGLLILLSHFCFVNLYCCCCLIDDQINDVGIVGNLTWYIYYTILQSNNIKVYISYLKLNENKVSKLKKLLNFLEKTENSISFSYTNLVLIKFYYICYIFVNSDNLIVNKICYEVFLYSVLSAKKFGRSFPKRILTDCKKYLKTMSRRKRASRPFGAMPFLIFTLILLKIYQISLKNI